MWLKILVGIELLIVIIKAWIIAFFNFLSELWRHWAPIDSSRQVNVIRISTGIQRWYQLIVTSVNNLIHYPLGSLNRKWLFHLYFNCWEIMFVWCIYIWLTFHILLRMAELSSMYYVMNVFQYNGTNEERFERW